MNRNQYMREYTLENKDKISKQRKVRLEKESLEKRGKRLKRMIIWRSKNSEYLKEYSRKQYQKDITKYSTYQKEAEKRGYEFSLDYSTFLKLFHDRCTYCGKEDSRGIDRVDNTIGYIAINCKGCCSICNYMKKDMTKEKFLEQISIINKIANA